MLQKRKSQEARNIAHVKVITAEVFLSKIYYKPEAENISVEDILTCPGNIKIIILTDIISFFIKYSTWFLRVLLFGQAGQKYHENTLTLHYLSPRPFPKNRLMDITLPVFCNSVTSR